MSAPIKTSDSKQISWCLRLKDKNGKSYNQNRKDRRSKKHKYFEDFEETKPKSKFW